MGFFTLSGSASSSSSFLLKTLPFLPTNSSTKHLYHPISIKPQTLISISVHSRQPLSCRAAAKQKGTGSVKKKPPSSKKRGSSKPVVVKEAEYYDDDDAEDSAADFQSNEPASLPKPPAGFVLDSNGKVLMASSKRIATIVDSTNNLPLECIIRRVFRSSRGVDCMLLCPVDTPVQILKSSNIDGWTAVCDDEVEGLLPAVAYALAKIHMHMVSSGFCYTARGLFCYSEEDIFEFGSGKENVLLLEMCFLFVVLSRPSVASPPLFDDGSDIEGLGLPTEGVQITCFHQDGEQYMIYTPSDPLLFVAVRGENGQLEIAGDDLLEDPAIVDAFDEETEFNALVEEESALLESLLGEQ